METKRYEYLLGLGCICTLGGSLMIWGGYGLLFGAGLVATAVSLHLSER